MSDIEGAKMLEYENQIFLDSFHDDGLLVMAKWVPVLWSVVRPGLREPLSTHLVLRITHVGRKPDD